MPSMQWAGLRWHLPTDAVPLVSFVILIFNLIWVVVYLIVMLAVSYPSKCGPDNSRTATELAAIWGIFAFFIANIATSGLFIIIGSFGTPLTPSRRWLIPKLMYIDIAKYIGAVGYIAWSLYYVIDTEQGCWSPGRKQALEGILWASLSIIVMLM